MKKYIGDMMSEQNKAVGSYIWYELLFTALASGGILVTMGYLFWKVWSIENSHISTFLIYGVLSFYGIVAVIAFGVFAFCVTGYFAKPSTKKAKVLKPIPAMAGIIEIPENEIGVPTTIVRLPMRKK